ncbi:hypothetical protein AB0230_12525 [Microbacterium sp. NPDC089190]|uniref:hypothetical protein n=1 Tax=Microbacterium sp. NPDC089190 TaxID=3155063 RepID=UPI00344CBD61
MSEMLLDGPRGRRLCLEYACRDPRLADLVSSYAFHHRDERSTVIAFDDGERAPIPDPGVGDIADVLAAASAAPLDDVALAAALRATVDVARYWQEPDTLDGLCSDPRVIGALSPLARDLLRHAGGRWNRERSEEQWAVQWRRPEATGPLAHDAAGALAAWDADMRAQEESAREEWPSDPTARLSGEWWSVPVRLLSTRGGIDAALDLVEDSLGEEVATVVPVVGSGRTLEIRGAADWAALCRRYPVEVTASRRHDWFRTTGRDGRWLVPDWGRVAHEWEAVHLTTLGYLAGATRAITVDDEYASVIAGWEPDSTIWLADAVVESGDRQEWRRDHPDAAWTRVA